MSYSYRSSDSNTESIYSQAEEDPYAVLTEPKRLGDVSSAIGGYVDYQYEIGRKGRGSGQFGGWIQHFAASVDGSTLYTCDLWNKRIQIFSLQSRKAEHAFPSNMAGFQFQPRGIGILRNGNICLNCVGFEGVSRIGIFSPEGRVISYFGPGVIGSACAMTVDNTDRITIMDRRKMKITSFSKEGKVISSFNPEIKTDILRLASDTNGRIIVPDHLNDTVVIFEPNGRAVQKIRPRPGSGHCFKYPAGVACDADDNILICDVGNHRVLQFSPEGVYRSTVLNKQDHGLWRPHDIVATMSGKAIISEVSQTFVKVFGFQKSRRFY